MKLLQQLYDEVKQLERERLAFSLDIQIAAVERLIEIGESNDESVSDYLVVLEKLQLQRSENDRGIEVVS